MADTERQPSSYAVDSASKHKREIILPCYVPWECRNQGASQKGMTPIGGGRRQVTAVVNSDNVQDSPSAVGYPPLLTNQHYYDKTLASQSGMSAFGGLNQNVNHTVLNNKKQTLREVTPSRCELKKKQWVSSDRFVSKFGQYNPEAKDASIGRPRQQILEIHGGRRWTRAERIASDSLIPKMLDCRSSVSPSGTGAGIAGFHLGRQVETKVTGLESLSDKQRREGANQLGWVTGWSALDSQARTGGFSGHRDPGSANGTYFTKPIPVEPKGSGLSAVDKWEPDEEYRAGLRAAMRQSTDSGGWEVDPQDIPDPAQHEEMIPEEGEEEDGIPNGVDAVEDTQDPDPEAAETAPEDDDYSYQ